MLDPDEELQRPLTSREAEPVPLTWLFNFVRPHRVSIASTSGGNHVPTSYHYRYRAVDVIGSPAAMHALMTRAVQRHQEFREAFYDPFGRYVKNGEIRQGAIGGHSDHVHLAR